MARFDPPEKFDITKPDSWPDWRQRFQRFRAASKLKSEDEETQISALIYSMGPEAEHIFKTFDAAKAAVYDEVIKCFDAHFTPKLNIIYERAKFRSRVQKSGENVETFVRALYELAETCNFGNSKQDNIRDSIVIGLADKTVSQKLQMKSDLTLDQAIQYARQSEMVKSQNSTVESDHVSSIRNPSGRSGFRKSSNRQDNSNRASSESCDFCGYDPHPRNKCPARKEKCNKCGSVGHFRRKCYRKHSQKGVKAVNADDSDSDHDTGP